MDLQAKILSQKPGRERHLVALGVEILKADGTRFNPPKVLTVEVTDNAVTEDVSGAVRTALEGFESIGDLVGRTFSLKRGR